jgi:hypothetical protein
MNDETRDFLRGLLAEFGFLLAPLIEAAERPEWLYDLCSLMGWNLEGLLGADLAALPATLSALQADFEAVAAAADQPDTPAVVAHGHVAAQDALAQIESLRPILTDASIPDLTPALAEAFTADLLTLLVLRYLSARWPTLYALATLIGAIREEQAAPIYTQIDGETVMARMPIVRPALAVRTFLDAGADALGPLLAGLLPAEPPSSPQAYLDQVGAAIHERMLWAISRVGDSGLDGVSIRLDVLGLDVSGERVPRPDPAAGPITLALPLDYSPVLTIDQDAWRLTWTRAVPAPGSALALFAHEGFEIALLGDDAPHCAARGLTLAGADGDLILRVAGGVQVALPADALSGAAGDRVAASACARLEVAWGEPASLHLDDISLSGDFHIGGAGGLAIRDALISVGGLAFPVAAGDGLRLDVAGRLVMGIGEIGVRAHFDGAGFDIESTGTLALGDGVQLQPVNDMPVLRLRYVRGQTGLIRADAAGAVLIPEAGGGTGLLVEVAGYLELEQTGAGLRVTACAIGGAVALDALTVRDDLRLESASVVIGYAEATGFSLMLGGTAGLIRRGDAPAAAGLDGYALAVDDFRAVLATGPAGHRLTLAQGTISLAAPRFFAPAGRPAVAFDPADPLVISYDPSGGALSLEGAITFRDFGVRLSSGAGPDEPSAALTSATLRLRPGSPPAFEAVSGALHLPLGKDGMTIGLEDASWDLEGLPTGTIALQHTVSVDLGGGYALELLGAPDPAAPRMAFSALPDSSGAPVFTFSGAARLSVPTDSLSRDPGDPAYGDGRVYAEASGSLVVPTAPGARPSLQGLTFAVGGSFRLGDSADAILIRDARLEAAGIDNLLAPSESQPFTLTLDGTIVFPDGGPAVALDAWRFIFITLTTGPRFAFTGLRVAPGAYLNDHLPIKVHQAGIAFRLPDLPLPDLLAPDNVIATLSIGLDVPLGSAAAMARADNVTVQFERGLPRVSIGGIGFGVDNLMIMPSLIVSGAVYLGGLDTALTDPNAIIVAGKLGAKFNGIGGSALVAFRGLTPLGVCLDVSAGPAGIPLGPTGFLLTGVSGGVSYANRNTDPCEIATYIQIGADGLPRTVDPPPALTDGARVEDAAMETARPATGDRPDCPGDCPPPSMNLLCQPHPDPALYPGRAILKFSAIDEAFLEQLTVPGQGISVRAYLQQHASASPAAIVETLMDTLRAAIGPYMPQIPPTVDIQPPLPPELDAIARDPFGHFEHAASAALIDAITAAGGGRPLYDIIVEALYRGIDCPDMTLQLTGTFSYAGISAFLSVTGGINVSTSGSAGILGSVNFFGIPIGQLRAFLSLTDAQGNPNPALCGDLRLALGPLEVGNLTFHEACDGCIMGQIDAVMTTVNDAIANGAEPLIRDRLRRLDPSLPHGAGINALLASLTPEQWLALLGDLALDPPLGLAQHIFTTLIERCWDAFNPSYILCGEVAPRLFGLSLGEGLVGAQAWITKQSIGGNFSFSPLYLLGRLFPLADLFAGMDSASLGFALEVPDPVRLVLDGLKGGYRTPDELAAYLETGFQRLLDHAVLTMAYEFSPLGLKLTDAEVRVILPRLTDHPARPGSAWQRPEARGLPGRVAVLIAALEQDLLADALWKGDLSGLAVGGQPLAGLELARDYFPHGGIAGAGRIEMPRALVDAPPMALFQQMFDGSASLMDRLGAAISYVNDYVLQTERMGQLVFYMPAPNPPTFATGQGAPLTPRALMDALINQDFGPGTLQAGPLFSAEMAFLQGELRGRLLGIEIGSAEMVGIPPDAGSEGRFEVRARIPRGSWLAEVVGEASLTFAIRQAPPLPVEVYFQMLALVLANPPRSPAQADALIDRFMRESDLEDVASSPAAHGPGGAVSPAALDDMRESRMRALAPLFASVHALAATLRGISPTDATATAQTLLNAFMDAAAAQLPKVSLEARVTDLRLPGILRTALGLAAGATITLHAYSPFYAPGARGDGPLATIQRNGGIALRISDLRFGAGPFNGVVRNAELAIWPAAAPGLVGIAADLDVGTVNIPGLRLRNARLRFGTEPNPYFALSGEAERIELGALVIEPLPGRSSIQAHIDSSGRLSISPARLTVPFLGSGAVVRIHGATPNDPFTFSTDRAWAASLSIQGFAVVNPLAPTAPPLLTMPGTVSAQLAGDGLRSANLTVRVTRGSASQAPITLLPGTPLSIGGGASGEVVISSTGTFAYTCDHTATLPGFSASGRLSVGASLPRGNAAPAAHARLTDAQVTLGGLPAAQGEVSFALAGISAALNLGAGRIGIPNLLEISAAGQWALQHTFASGEFRLAVSGTMGAWLLGQALPSPRALEIAIVGGVTRVRCASDGWLPLLPGLAEVRAQSLDLRLAGTNSTVDFSGGLRLFRRADNQWNLERDASFALRGGPFEVPVLTGAQIALLPTSGLFFRRNDTALVFGRRQNGTLYLRLDKVRVAFGGERSLDAEIASDGRAFFRWDMNIVSNGLTLTPGGPVEVGARLTVVGLAALLRIPAGKVRASFSGWPAAGFDFPEISVGSATPTGSRSYSHTARSWQDVPGFGSLQYRATAPNIEVSLNGTALSARLVGGIEVRVKGTQPNGQAFPAWSAGLTAPISATGTLQLPLPARSILQAPLNAARSACETLARNTHVLPSLPPMPNPPARPTRPPQNAPAQDWVAYNSALWTYDNVLMPTYRTAKDTYDAARATYDAALAALNQALQSCANSYPSLPQLPGSFSVSLSNVLS